MNQKQLRIYTPIVAALLVIIGVLAKILVDIPLLGTINAVICPLLFLATLVFGYLLFKDSAAYPCKWIWAVIAIQAGAALQCLVNIPTLIMDKLPVLDILALALGAAGSGLAVYALLKQNATKLLLIALGVLAVSAILDLSIPALMVYALLAIILTGRFPGANKILRTIAVIAAIFTGNVLTAACWIIFAFILVPAQKITFRVSLAKITAILCVILAIVSLVTFFTNRPTSQIKATEKAISRIENEIKRVEKSIPDLEAELADHQDTLADAQKVLPTAQEDLAAAQKGLAQAEQALDAAADALDAVCYRSYYSYFSCDSSCRDLHNAEEDAEEAVDNQQDLVDACQRTITDLEATIEEETETIESLTADIADAKENLAKLQKDLVRTRGQLSADYFNLLMKFIALLAGLAGLWFLTKAFFTETYQKPFFLGCGAVAGSGLLSILLQGPVTVWTLLLNPHFWGIVALGLLAYIAAAKPAKPIKFRVFAVIAAVLLAASVVATPDSVPNALYALVLICGAFALVPVVFTEYNSIAKHLFLSLISFGIWPMIWIYHVTKNLNKVSGMDQRKPARELLLYLFLPFYYIYWLLKTGEYVEAYAKEKGKEFKLDVLCLVFAFIMPLISTVLIQNKINLIVGKPQ